MTKKNQSSLEWISKLLDALEARVVETKQSSDYNTRIAKSRELLNAKVKALSQASVSPQLPSQVSTKFQDMVGPNRAATNFVKQEEIRAEAKDKAQTQRPAREF